MGRNNASRSYQIQALVKQVEEASDNDRWVLHGIDVDEYGVVHDNCYGKHFDSVHGWATFNIDMEALDNDSSTGYGALSDD